MTNTNSHNPPAFDEPMPAGNHRAHNIINILIMVACSLLTIQAFAQGRSWPENILQKSFDITTQAQIDVPLDEMYQGCAKRDCIPSIDAPSFVSATQASHMDEEDLVLGLDYAGTVRAYPAFILNHHEVVNDTLNGDHIAITYCPLCGSGVAFRGEIDGRVATFGVSGLLHNSDLVLYDRETESMWQQITGIAIAGPKRGEALKAVPLTMTTWRDWHAAHPDTMVLTGSGQVSYENKQPYGDYDESKRLMFPANSSAGLILHPKQVVYGIRITEGAAAITERLLVTGEEIKVETGGVTLSWRREADGKVVVQRGDNGENLLPHRMFWFAWYSFNTDTTLRDIDHPPSE